VEEFVSTLSRKDEENMTKSILHLRNVGHELRRPHGAYLRDGIYELRVNLLGENTRTLYFFCLDDYIVLTHIFKKKTREVPDKQIEKAIKYRNTFLEKYNKTNIEEAYNVGGLRKI
jgi:phage-related protein